MKQHLTSNRVYVIFKVVLMKAADIYGQNKCEFPNSQSFCYIPHPHMLQYWGARGIILAPRTRLGTRVHSLSLGNSLENVYCKELPIVKKDIMSFFGKDKVNATHNSAKFQSIADLL